ncbi:peptidase M18 [Rhypophila decipiens]|uniref:aspartyl aminopeptidase n=1 Tax=Rhypophila decipiens TaxID=261697 RepID=A0AAN6YFF1_9PEZI|nr:peptidase M18 [Rhypophila decipiens]
MLNKSQAPFSTYRALQRTININISASLSSLHVTPLIRTSARPRQRRATTTRSFNLNHFPSYSSSAPFATMAPPGSAKQFVDFVNASPTPYHAVASAVKLFEAAGFKQIRERDDWSSSVKPGGKYYLTRNGSSIVAFSVGAKWKPGNPVGIVGAHTDSPCLRVKPVSKKTANGYLQVGVEIYGGGIWHSWFDRDLGVAGRVFVNDGSGKFVQKLVHINRPILRIPRLAIHLDRNTNFDPNKEDELLPILGLVAAELNKTDDAAPEAEKSEDDFQPLKDIKERHHPYFLELVAEQIGVKTSQIDDFELVLFDTQASCFGGLREEFIFSARLDNLDMTFCAIKGLLASVDSTSLENDASIRMIASFDHEEIGSCSAHGADSNFLPAVLRRLCAPSGSDAPSEAFEQTLNKSFLISADMAHAVHPNYARKYEGNHQPEMNKGTVIKINANQRYATNSPGIVLVKEAARLAGVPLQLFVVKNDSPCGGTIGPMLSAKLGIRTLDLGNPQLSMHSIRETGGTWDVEYSIKLFESFLSRYGELEEKILVD